MNIHQEFKLNNTYFGYTKLMVILLGLINCVGCSGQVNQKDTTQTKPTAQTEIKAIPQDDNNIILNQYEDREKDGLSREYYQNGQLKSEGIFTNGLKEGLHREWGDNGILLLEGLYVKGKANGLMKWFHERGHLAGEGDMINDLRVGPWKICDIEENGFCIEAFFKNGKRDGIWKIYHEDARDKIWKEQTFEEDKMLSEKCWDKIGKQIICK